MRTARENRDVTLPSWLSTELYKALTTCMENKEQAALFLNRRGFAQCLVCPDCGYSETCPNCSVTLTAHKRGVTLLCHYCAFTKPMPAKCTSCKSGEYRPMGMGTERIAEDIQSLYAKRGVTVRVARADRDEINTREKLEDLLTKIHNKEIDILVGTQMIAKGHDFPDLTLVGVVLADVGLHIPDFRSSERIFQLITQVAGRAGRHQKPGRVLIQSYVPEHISLRCAQKHDYLTFATEELKARAELNYPPFGRMACLRIQGSDQQQTEHTAFSIAQHLEKYKSSKNDLNSIEILGPCEAVLAKLKNKFRFQIIIKSTSASVLNGFMQYALQLEAQIPQKIDLSADVDPVSLL
jgi:primosomal protein N' (replication factor Y)